MEPEQDRGRRLLCFGAHPDDCEIKSAGLAALWTRAAASSMPRPTRLRNTRPPLTNQATATLFPF